MPVIKGTASVADSRALSKALRSTKFPDCFKTPVDISKINRAVLTQWIEQKVEEALGFEDEIVQSTAVNTFLPELPEDGSAALTPVDPRVAQTTIAGFLGEEKAALFAKELWELMLDAQTAPTGIPRKLLEQQKKKMARANPPPPPPAAARPNGNRRPQDRRHGDQRRAISPPRRIEVSRSSRSPPPPGRERRRDRSCERRPPPRHTEDRSRDDRYYGDNRYRDEGRRYYNDRPRNEDRRRRDDYYRGGGGGRPHRSYEEEMYRSRGDGGARGDDRYGDRYDDYGRRRISRTRERSRSPERPRRRYSHSSESSASSRSSSTGRGRR